MAIRLNNIAGVLREKGDYAGALEKYREALAIFEKFLGADHPNTQTVRENLQYTWWQSLSEKEQWALRTQVYLEQLSESVMDTLKLALLNQIGVGYIKQEKADSALIYLRQALPLARALGDREMEGTALNNLGSAHKLAQNWPLAKQFLRRSVAHNRATQGDSAAVLAFTYFHLAGMHQAQSWADSARFYAQKSLTLARKHALEDLIKQAEALLQKR